MIKNLTLLTIALAAGVVAVPALADMRVPLSADAVASHQAANPSRLLTHVRASHPAAPGTAAGTTAKVMGIHTQPGTPGPNDFRAYPPSCAADPLPDKASGPQYTASVPLYATDPNNVQTAVIEVATVTVWRIACSSSGAHQIYNPNGYPNAITLVRIDRHDDTITSDVPRFPLLQVKQGSIDFTVAGGGRNPASFVRAAVEPNTVVSEMAFDNPVVTSTTYALENNPYQGSGYFAFSDAFTLRIDPFIAGVTPVDISVPAYIPSQATYPDAYTNLPISGYMSSAWYSPDHNGEGLVVQLLENPDGVTHAVFAAWYTYDALGLPFWLIAQGVINPGDKAMLNAPVTYLTGGGFAGNFGAAADTHTWGTMSMSFPDCNTIHFTYSGQTDAQTAGPAGSGTRDWTRLASVNGLTCE